MEKKGTLSERIGSCLAEYGNLKAEVADSLADRLRERGGAAEGLRCPVSVDDGSAVVVVDAMRWTEAGVALRCADGRELPLDYVTALEDLEALWALS